MGSSPQTLQPLWRRHRDQITDNNLTRFQRWSHDVGRLHSIQRSDFELSETIHVPEEPKGGRVILAIVRIWDQAYRPRPVTSLTITTITTITKII